MKRECTETSVKFILIYCKLERCTYDCYVGEGFLNGETRKWFNVWLDTQSRVKIDFFNSPQGGFFVGLRDPVSYFGKFVHMYHISYLSVGWKENTFHERLYSLNNTRSTPEIDLKTTTTFFSNFEKSFFLILL